MQQTLQKPLLSPLKRLPRPLFLALKIVEFVVMTTSAVINDIIREEDEKERDKRLYEFEQRLRRLLGCAQKLLPEPKQ